MRDYWYEQAIRKGITQARTATRAPTPAATPQQPPQLPTMIIGVDLGAVRDPTAISAVDCVQVPTGEYDFKPAGGGTWKPTMKTEPRCTVRFLERPKLGTPYPEVVERVRVVAEAMRRKGYAVKVVIDGGGVGKPVLDMMRAARMSPISICLTGGDAVNEPRPSELRVPKQDVVTALVVSMQTGRLKLAHGLAEGEALKNELKMFRSKTSQATRHTSYNAASGHHDDLIISVGLAVWYASRPGAARGAIQRWPGGA